MTEGLIKEILVAKIDKDYINDVYSDYYRADTKEFVAVYEFGRKILLESSGIKTRFRCKDDDGEIYYAGWLYNDSECEIQLEVLRWSQADAGCATIEIHKNGKWVQEIG